MRRFLICAALLTNMLTAGEISGRLFDRLGGVISGARVMLMDQDYVKLSETKSGEQGGFAFQDVKPALYFVQAKKPRFNLAQQHILLTADKPGRVYLIANPGRGEEEFTLNGNFGGDRPRPVPQTFQPGGRIDDYKLVKRVMPVLTEPVRARGARGTVVLCGTVRADGTIADVLTLDSPDPELERISKEAFSQWRYVPVKLNGVVVEVTTSAIFNFR